MGLWRRLGSAGQNHPSNAHSLRETFRESLIRLLTRACDRLFVQPVSLPESLRHYPADTLHLLSTRPEHFGAVFDDVELRRQRLSDLLTAARTYLAHERKMASDLRVQGELPLTGAAD